MSDFSCKCREYLKLTGETVYQLAASSGLDRTSLQRMITGKRLPGTDQSLATTGAYGAL